MTGFEVDVAAVFKIADQQRRLAEDAKTGKGYISTNTDLAFNGEGLINLIAGGHRDVRALAERYHESVHSRSATPGKTAFTRAAEYYRDTDRKVAADLDSTYPPSNADEAEKGLKVLQVAGSPFGDLHEPTAKYTTPPDYNAEFPYEPAWTDVLSPTALCRDAVWGVTALAAKLGLLPRAYDPLETFVKPLSGDWAKLRACADIYSNVAFALGHMADNVQWTGQRLDDFWRGNAADSAQLYLFQLTQSLTAAQAPFHELAEQYKAAAQGAADLGKVVGGLICDLVDAVLIFVAAAEGVAVSAGSIVGIPLAVIIADAALVAEIIKCVQIVLKLLEIVDKFNDLIDTFNAACGNFGRIVVPENMPTPSPSGPARLPG